METETLLLIVAAVAFIGAAGLLIVVITEILDCLFCGQHKKDVALDDDENCYVKGERL